MLSYVLRRLIYMIISLWAISIVTFVIIQLPPGDYLSLYVLQLESRGIHLNEEEIVLLRKQFGLDKPVYIQYFKWVGGALQGDFGRSFAMNRPVSELIGERL